MYEKAPSRLRRTVVREWARTIAARVATNRSFTCLIAPAETLRRLNREFRGKDEATDVLSFPATLAGADHLGDLAISWPHVRAQARALGHTAEEEIAVLMLHGVLHLMGMDHETDSGQMRRAEARWRRQLGLPLGLTERAAL